MSIHQQCFLEGGHTGDNSNQTYFNSVHCMRANETKLVYLNANKKKKKKKKKKKYIYIYIYMYIKYLNIILYRRFLFTES